MLAGLLSLVLVLLLLALVVLLAAGLVIEHCHVLYLHVRVGLFVRLVICVVAEQIDFLICVNLNVLNFGLAFVVVLLITLIIVINGLDRGLIHVILRYVHGRVDLLKDLLLDFYFVIYLEHRLVRAQRELVG